VKILTFALLLLASYGSAAEYISTLAGPGKIRIAVDEWPPYQSQKYKYHGSAHRIISEAFAQSGIQVQYGWHQWAESLKKARSGEWDGAALSQWSEDKAKYFLFSEPVMSAQKVFFHLQDQPVQWQDYSDLNKLVIGGTTGYSYGKTFDEADRNGDLTMLRVAKNEQGFRMLFEKRIDTFLFERRAGYFLIHKKFPNQLTKISHHPKPVQKVKYHLILSKRVKENAQRLEQFNKGLKQLKDKGLVEYYLREGLAGRYDSDN